jgi:very-short-patch-repair endonuclease
VPVARRHLVAWADRAAASGIETFVRFLCLVMGLRVRTQPEVPGVGRGDLEVEGVLIIEADSREFHDAEVTTRDRQRDAGYVRAGYIPLHFRYAQIVYEPRAVAETILAALVAHRGIRNSGELVRRARRRLDSAGIS